MLTDLIVRAVAGDAGAPLTPVARNRCGTVVSALGLACNVLLCAGKALVGVAVGSVSIVADAVNNLSDASSNVVSLLGFRLAAKPADTEHPFGHGRYEYLSGLVVATLVTAIGIELLLASFRKICEPAPTEFGPAVVAVLLVSAAVKLWMASLNARMGRRIGSTTLEATATDSRNDVITTLAVLGAAVLSRLTGFDLDGWAGLLVGAFVVASGVGLVGEAVSPLLGKAPDPELVRHVHDKVMGYPGVLGTHDLMVHDYGPGRRFASAHVEMPAELDPLASHETIDRIERDLAAERLPTVLHYDPIVTRGDGTDLRGWLEGRLRLIDRRLSVHDVRQDGTGDEETVTLHCVLPHDVPMDDAELLRDILAAVAERRPGAACAVTIDHGYDTGE